MAKIIKIAKYVKTPRVEARPAFQRRPAKPGLYLLALRSHTASAQSSQQRRKLVITIDSTGADRGLPKPVKITHI